MRVIVCGGRDYADKRTLWSYMDNMLRLHPDLSVMEGGNRKRYENGTIDWSTSADALVNWWCEARGVPCKTEPAEWEKHRVPGRKNPAGPIRNAKMLREFQPDAVIRFPGGAGTADCVRQAKAAGVRVIEVGT